MQIYPESHLFIMVNQMGFRTKSHFPAPREGGGRQKAIFAE
jgi:hypothetical protein